MTRSQSEFLQRAISLARTGMQKGAGGPFGAIIVKDGKIIGEGYNKVTSSFDPTAHAEIVAIREACKALETFQLDGCEIYCSCEPCPMCLGAIYWARPDKIWYAANREDAAEIGFDDDFVYKEIAIKPMDRTIPAINAMRDEAVLVFDEWKSKTDRIDY